MSQEELNEELQQLGIDEGSYKMVALLPLVHVAWADGAVQASERTLILKIADKRGFADEAGAKVLESWLKDQPSPYFLHRGRKVLEELYDRQSGIGAEIDKAFLEDLLAFCEGVADSAGGVFGLFGRVANEEKEAISKIAGALRVDPSKRWADVKSEFD